jgi:hypothetical protein
MDPQQITAKIWDLGKKFLWAIIIVIVVIIVLLLIIFAFYQSKKATTTAQPGYYGEAGLGISAPSMALLESERAMVKTAEDVNLDSSTTASSIEKKVIKTASLDITVDDVNKTVGQITNEAVLVNGFVQNSSMTENEKGQKYANIIIRVPVNSFESIISKIKSLAKLVEREDINGREVTEEYVDLQASLTHNQAVEAQYLELLKRAQDVEEIIAVRDKLDQVQGEIEMIKGRLRFLDNQTEMATIAINISSEAKVTLPAEKWQPWVVVKEAAKNFIVGLQNFVNFIVYFIFFLISLIPYLILIYLIYLLVKLLIKKYKKPKQTL